VQKFAVGLEVKQSSWLEKTLVSLKKRWVYHAVLGALVLDLWVGEGDPELVYFAWSEGIFNPFDAGAQKSNLR
jgi:hypothetical protein